MTPVNSIEAAPRLGELLIERGLIAAEDLDRALELQNERGDKLGRILVDMGYLAQRDLLNALSAQLGLPIATLIRAAIGSGTRRALAAIPAPVAALPCFHRRKHAHARDG